MYMDSQQMFPQTQKFNNWISRGDDGVDIVEKNWHNGVDIIDKAYIIQYNIYVKMKKD